MQAGEWRRSQAHGRLLRTRLRRSEYARDYSSILIVQMLMCCLQCQGTEITKSVHSAKSLLHSRNCYIM